MFACVYIYIYIVDTTTGAGKLPTIQKERFNPDVVEILVGTKMVSYSLVLMLSEHQRSAAADRIFWHDSNTRCAVLSRNGPRYVVRLDSTEQQPSDRLTLVKNSFCSGLLDQLFRKRNVDSSSLLVSSSRR